MALPPIFSVDHPIIHLYMLRRYIFDKSQGLHWDLVQLEKKLTFIEEPVSLLAKDVRRLHSRDIHVFKVHGRHRPIEESTWKVDLTCVVVTNSFLPIQVFFCILVRAQNRILVVDDVMTQICNFFISMCFDHFHFPVVSTC